MKTSENIAELTAALIKAQSEFKSVPKTKTAVVKTKTGGEYSYKFADLADVLAMALPVLRANGIFFSQPSILTDGRIRISTHLIHSSGQWMASDGIELRAEEPQIVGAESTYYRRYDGCAMLGIAPDEDIDAVQTIGNTGRKEVVRASSKPKHGTDIPHIDPPGIDDPVFDEEGNPVPTVAQNDARPGKAISAKQVARFWAIALKNKTKPEINSAIAAAGLSSIEACPWGDIYDSLIEWAQS